ncbi:MAG: hypothetical protein MZW92_66525 [Comamonadaceae bacterium]|nr:hypothetical protein [Comamonadaceae bacterium]
MRLLASVRRWPCWPPAAAAAANVSNAPTGLQVGDATDLKTVLAAVPLGGGGGGGAATPCGCTTTDPTATTPAGRCTPMNAPGEALGGWPGRARDGDAAGVRQVLGRAGRRLPRSTSSSSRTAAARASPPAGAARPPATSSSSGTLAERQRRSTRSPATPTNYARNPLGAPTPDIDRRVRVHYRRFDGQYANWGVHIWASSGLDVAAPAAGRGDRPVDQRGAVRRRFRNYTAGDGEVVFDIPVLNPQDDASRTDAASSSSTASRRAATRTTRTAATTTSRRQLRGAERSTTSVGEIWLVQGDADRLHRASPDTALGVDHRCARLLADRGR